MKNIIILVLFAVLTFPAYKALRHPGLIYGHDSESVLFRSIEFRQAIADGNFPVRWSKRLDYGLGQPTFTFTYNLPYYLSFGLGLVGLSELWSFKLIYALSFPLSAFFAYLWLRKHVGTKAALLGGLFYTYSPYHFANVYVRAAFGEIVAATVAPLVFYGVFLLATKTDLRNIAKCGLLVALMALSHNFYLIILLPILTGYYFVVARNFRIWTVIAWGLVVTLGIGLASYYLIPAFVYKDLTFLTDMARWFSENNNFITAKDLLASSWGFGGLRRDGGDGLLSIQIGLVHLALATGSLILILKNRLASGQKKVTLFFLIVLCGIVFLMHKESTFVWDMLPILKNLQFPWRLMFVVNLVVAFCIGLFFDRNLKTVIVFTLIIGLIGVSSRYWHVHRYFPWIDPTPKTIGYPGTLTMLFEETPRWHEIRQEPNPHFLAQVSSGEADTSELAWKTNYQAVSVDCKHDCVIAFKTHFWPGWKVYVDSKETALIDPYDELSQGLLSLKVPNGKHIVEAKLSEPLLGKIGDTVTIFFGLITTILFVAPSKFPFLNRNKLWIS